MNDLDAVPNPKEDLKHAHELLARMTAEELLRATYAMEDILDGAVYVTHDGPLEDEVIDPSEEAAVEKGRHDLAEGRIAGLEDLLEACGLPKDSLNILHKTSGRNKAA